MSFPLTLQRQQSLGKGSGSWRLAIRTMKQATLQAPPCAAPLRSTNVTYTICTDPSGEFHTCHGNCGLVRGGRLSVWNELETRAGVRWLELNAVHILNCHVDDWKMRTSRWDLNHLACCCSLSLPTLWFSLHSPPSLRDRLDLFYVQPDPACDPDGQLWFTSTPLERQILEKLLTRVLLVRDVYTDKHYPEEDVEGVDGVEAAGAD